MLITKPRNLDTTSEFPLLIAPSLREDLGPSESIRYTSKIFKVSDDVCIAVAGNILIAKSIIAKLSEIVSNSITPFKLPELASQIKNYLTPAELEETAFILMGGDGTVMGYESVNCKTFYYKNGIQVVLGGTGGTFLEFLDQVDYGNIGDNKINMFRRDNPGERGKWVPLAEIVGDITTKIYGSECGIIAQNDIIDYSYYATGGWLEIAQISPKGIQKLSSLVFVVNRDSTTGQLTLVSVRKLAYDGQKPYILEAKFSSDFVLVGARPIGIDIGILSDKHSTVSSNGEIDLDFLSFFIDTGFGEYSSHFANYCIVLSDGEPVGIELLWRNPINFELLSKQPDDDDKYQDVLIGYLTDSIIRNLRK